MTSRACGARGARSPRSYYDVILIVTSFATELAMLTGTDVRPLRTPYRVQYINIMTPSDRLILLPV